MDADMWLLLQLLLMVSYFQGVKAYTYSCDEIQNRILNAEWSQYSKYACVVTQEGYSNSAQLDKVSITADQFSTSLNSLVDWCWTNEEGVPWKLTADKGFTLNCDEAFTLILSSDKPNIIKPAKQAASYTVQRPHVLAVPQGGMWIHVKACTSEHTGDHSIKVWTGAGEGENEDRFLLRTFTCYRMPKWIFVFDMTITLEANGVATLTMETSSDLTLSQYKDPQFAENEGITILSTGLASDIQSKQGRNITAIVQINDKIDVTYSMQLAFDPSNTGSVGLRKSRNGDIISFQNGLYGDTFQTNYFEILWLPKALPSFDISWNEDNINIDIWLSNERRMEKIDDSYCNCDKDRMNNGDLADHGFEVWNTWGTWLDIVYIIDASEAMGAEAIQQATTLIEGMFNSLEDDPSRNLFSRFGVIAMADTAQVLYSLNMTGKDKVQGKVQVKKGLANIDVVKAFTAAQLMFSDGLVSNPDRNETRQVVYYLTASAPNSDLSSLTQFKHSGVVIVNNLVKGEPNSVGLRKLASDGYYLASSDGTDSLVTYCKANCFCKTNNNPYSASGDPAISADGGCYRPELSALPYAKATDSCFQDKGYVAEIHDEHKAAYLKELMSASKSDYFWLGLTKAWEDWNWQIGWNDDDRSQAWIDYTNWDSDEPSSYSVANCAYVDTTQRSMPWGAGNCNVGFPYACEYRPCSVGNTNC